MGEISIKPNEWTEVLEGSVQSRKRKLSLSGERQSIYSSWDGKRIELFSEDQPKLKRQKMSISEIVDTSVKQFEVLRDSREQGVISREEYEGEAGKIKQLTNDLVDKRIEKRNRFGMIVLRTLAYAIAAVAMLIFGVGIPLWKKLRKMDADFSKEMAKFKQRIGQAFEKALELTVNEKIESQLAGIPAVLEKLDQLLSDKDRAESVQKRMVLDYPSDPSVRSAHQFEKDVIRGQAFIRKDHASKIDDTTPLPSYDLKGDERVEQGVALLEEMLRDNDEVWRFPLQLAANQTTLNTVFDAFIMLFNIEARMMEKWDDSESGMNVALKAQFPDKLPPIYLTVERDSIDGRITGVLVEVEGYLDIISYLKSNGSTCQVIAEKAVKGQLSYMIHLDEEDRPVISDLTSKLEVNGGLKRV